MSSMSCGICRDPLGLDYVKAKHSGCSFGYDNECVTFLRDDGETLVSFKHSKCKSCQAVPDAIHKKCPICYTIRNNEKELVNHMKHRHQTQVWCISCKPEQKFSSQSALKQHQKIKHKSTVSGATPSLPIKIRHTGEPKTATPTKSDYQDTNIPEIDLTNESSKNKLRPTLWTTPITPHGSKRKIEESNVVKKLSYPSSERKSRASSGDDEVEESSTKRQSTQSGGPVTKNKKFVKTVTYSLVPGSTQGEKKVTFSLEITSDDGMDSRSTTPDQENWKYLMDFAGGDD